MTFLEFAKAFNTPKNVPFSHQAKMVLVETTSTYRHYVAEGSYHYFMNFSSTDTVELWDEEGDCFESWVNE